MRAAAILGLGSSLRDLAPFQTSASVEWIVGLPAAASAADAILIFGGDGTIHRHLPQLIHLKLPVLIVPAGSGNDFARALGLRKIKDSLAAWQKFANGAENVRTVDLGVIIPLERPETGDTSTYQQTRIRHYFSCAAGCGLDAEIAKLANRLPRWLRAHGGYALSLPTALTSFTSFRTRIFLPKPGSSEGFTPYRSEQSVLIVCANTPVYGGGMQVAPKARMDDGKLDICHITQMNRLKLLCLFPTVYFGRHLGINDVEYFQTERLQIETDITRSVYADGEYVCQTPVEIGTLSSALRVIVA